MNRRSWPAKWPDMVSTGRMQIVCLRVASVVGVFLLSSLFATVHAQTQRIRIDPRRNAIDSIARAQADSGFSGVVLVAVRDTIVLHRAYSARGIRIPRPDSASAFWIGSITKGFTAAAIMRLQEQRRLSVRDSLYRFFPDARADKRAITIHQLLTQTSRITGNGAGDNFTDRPGAVRAILGEPLRYVPGSGYRNVDEDYQLLAAIVEVASGRRWEDYITAELLRPASLARTGFWCRPQRGVPEPIPGAFGIRSRCRAGSGGDWEHRGANGISSTAGDLFRWVRALDRGRVLSAASRAQLALPRVVLRREPSGSVGYAYGARVHTVDGRTAEVMQAGSGDDGHSGTIRVLSSGAVIVVLSNSGQRSGTTWSSHVANLVDAGLRP